jgi:tRNA-specific 2-thiouridylase
VNKRRVVIAMSGGVDSSVAALLLQRQGYDLVGVFMRHGSDTSGRQTHRPSPGSQGASLPIVPSPGESVRRRRGCCSAADAEDARRVADQLGIPFYALNLHEQFEQIVDYFVEEYSRGRTPNPCVVCNNWLKFGKLFEYADTLGADYVATGHYARLTGDEGELWLERGQDLDKDQSYVLFGVPRARLPRMLLPIGHYRKPEIRRVAAECGIRVAEKPDSQEICFVAPGAHADLVASRRGDADASGQLVTTDGKVVGTHRGIERFTIGQRKGLGVALGEPLYVVRIEAESRRVVIGRRDELARQELTIRDLNWLGPRLRRPLRCSVQIRYNSRALAAQISPQADGSLRVRFDEPCRGVAPGQAAVCYDGSRVLGGGWIA